MPSFSKFGDFVDKIGVAGQIAMIVLFLVLFVAWSYVVKMPMAVTAFICFVFVALSLGIIRLRHTNVVFELIPIDARFRNFDGPKSIRIEGEILGKAPRRSPYKGKTSSSILITVPFSETLNREYTPFDVLEKDGRRTLVYREKKECEN